MKPNNQKYIFIFLMITSSLYLSSHLLKTMLYNSMRIYAHYAYVQRCMFICKPTNHRYYSLASGVVEFWTFSLFSNKITKVCMNLRSGKHYKQVATWFYFSAVMVYEYLESIQICDIVLVTRQVCPLFGSFSSCRRFTEKTTFSD